MYLTYKYRLKDRRAAKYLRAHAYACNQVWNWCVAQHEDTLARYRAGAPKRRWLTHFDLGKECNGVGKDLGITQYSVQGVCTQFARSRNANKQVRFRASYGHRRATGWVPFPGQGRRIDGNSLIYLGRRYHFFGSKRRPLPPQAKGGAFVEDRLGRWWVFFIVEVAAPTPAIAGEVGIDLGLKAFATFSTGETIEAPRYYRALEVKLGAAQRAKNSRRVKSLHLKAASARRDFQHKLSTRLSREYALIAIGNVNAKHLAKTRMAKSVLDAGWSSFRKMLRYKSPGYIEVDEKFTTQICSECGSIAGPKGYAGLNKRGWDCPNCGASHDRDVNSARVILSRALSAQRRGDESQRGGLIGRSNG